MMHGVFIGRREKEKGIDLLIEALVDLATHKPHIAKTIQYTFFGDGSYKDELYRLSKKYPSHSLSLEGRQKKTTIAQYCKNNKVDLLIMPSQFLETFGLVAGEALSRGIPVGTYNTGGTAQFLISSEFALDTYPSLAEFLTHFSHKTTDDFLRYSQKAKIMASSFTKKTRKHNVDSLMKKYAYNKNNKQNYLLISDYKAIIGGIETHIHDSATILSSQGKTTILGGPIHTAWGRKIGLIVGSANILEACRILYTVIKQKPTVIWWHSVQRYLGWLPIIVVSLLTKHRKNKPLQLITYHDFGLFYPYPSRLTSLEQLKNAHRFRGYLSSSQAPWYAMPFIIAKWLYSRMIIACIKYSGIINIVPSEYMKHALRPYLGPSVTIETLPHFVI